MWQEGCFKGTVSTVHFQHTFEPIDPKDLITPEKRQEVLKSHMFLKEKQDQTVKGRVVLGGNKERSKIDKLDAVSPTAILKSILLTAVINTHERRDVALIDIPNTFVQTRLEDNGDKAVSMLLQGKLAKLMAKIAPKIYSKYVIINKKGETVLYGPTSEHSVWHHEGKCFVKDLKSIGFEINP